MGDLLEGRGLSKTRLLFCGIDLAGPISILKHEAEEPKTRKVIGKYGFECLGKNFVKAKLSWAFYGWNSHKIKDCTNSHLKLYICEGNHNSLLHEDVKKGLDRSKVVLSWLSSPPRNWKPFVAKTGRQKILGPIHKIDGGMYVKGKFRRIGSRGLSTKDLPDCRLWVGGPYFPIIHQRLTGQANQYSKPMTRVLNGEEKKLPRVATKPLVVWAPSPLLPSAPHRRQPPLTPGTRRLTNLHLTVKEPAETINIHAPHDGPLERETTPTIPKSVWAVLTRIRKQARNRQRRPTGEKEESPPPGERRKTSPTPTANIRRILKCAPVQPSSPRTLTSTPTDLPPPPLLMWAPPCHYKIENTNNERRQSPNRARTPMALERSKRRREVGETVRRVTLYLKSEKATNNETEWKEDENSQSCSFLVVFTSSKLEALCCQQELPKILDLIPQNRWRYVTVQREIQEILDPEFVSKGSARLSPIVERAYFPIIIRG
ncbi:hypothetical protein HNY73_022538 [Argiope bruennichi]|uniref:Uncharacterized protein n=1 Tax=Argiope bruennichi TaxID=94029 RepID=A0A8T0E3K1_ARGBR|nr:hypothetical protein HNY73_022538 [Argiope bruennichi]